MMKPLRAEDRSYARHELGQMLMSYDINPQEVLGTRLYRYFQLKNHSMMKTIKIIIATIMIAAAFPTHAQSYDFEEYIYPFGFRTYLSQDASGKTISLSQFSFSSQSFDNYIIEEVYVGLGMMSAKNTYRYRVEDNVVFSDVQLRQNALTGSTRYQDKIILFAFPQKDKPYTWTETDRGDNISGKSEYVFVNFQNQRIQAIKITKTSSYTTNKVKHKHIETSYWVYGYGRIVTYESIDGEERISSRIDLDELFVGFAELPSQNN
ncbi:MAG: hypothetical protein K6E93_04040 [Bacteroidales bacterium]|nr:hypothetical protein [Bacteroidales bacterium]